MRIVPERPVGGDIELRPGDQGGHGHDPAAEALAEDQHVRDAAHLLADEHGAGAAEAARHLIEDQQGSVAVAARPHLGPEAGRRRLDRGPAHGLGDHRSDVALHFEDVVDVVGQALVGAAVGAEEAPRQPRRRDMLGAGEQRPDILAEQRLAADRDGVQVRAVEGIPHRDRLVPAGGVAGELERHADGGRAAGRKQHLAQIARRQLDQAARQIDSCTIGVAARAEGQGIELGLDRRHDLGVAVADLMDTVAVEIEDAAALLVGEPAAGGVLGDVQAGCGERLAQEPALVFGQRVARRLVEMPRGPGCRAGDRLPSPSASFTVARRGPGVPRWPARPA